MSAQPESRPPTLIHSPDHPRDPLFPLSEFFAAQPSLALSISVLPVADLPAPYRSLLAHDSDMTSTLERFHGEPLRIRELASQRRQEALFRQVLLLGRDSEVIVEYGAICIQLSVLPAAARDEVLAAQRPLGAILARHAVDYASQPSLFFRLRSDGWINQQLGLKAPTDLYGRRNVLNSQHGRIADVVEILPPAG